jgi:hypothetical protein
VSIGAENSSSEVVIARMSTVPAIPRCRRRSTSGPLGQATRTRSHGSWGAALVKLGRIEEGMDPERLAPQIANMVPRMFAALVKASP